MPNSLPHPTRPDVRVLSEPAVDTLGRVWPAGTELAPADPPAPESVPSSARYEAARIGGELVYFATIDLSPDAVETIRRLV